jgi:hypothetical protein
MATNQSGFTVEDVAEAYRFAFRGNFVPENKREELKGMPAERCAIVYNALVELFDTDVFNCDLKLPVVPIRRDFLPLGEEY